MSRTLVLTAGVICGFLQPGWRLAAHRAASRVEATPAVRPASPFRHHGPRLGSRRRDEPVGRKRLRPPGHARMTGSWRTTTAGRRSGRRRSRRSAYCLLAGKRSLTISSDGAVPRPRRERKARALAAGKQVLGPGLRIQAKGAKRTSSSPARWSSCRARSRFASDGPIAARSGSTSRAGGCARSTSSGSSSTSTGSSRPRCQTTGRPRR